VPPSSPAAFSSRAQAVIRSSAARTWSGGQLPVGQGGVAGVLGPPLHPGELRRGLPSFPRLLWGGLHHRAGDRGTQPARGQPGRPVQDHGLGGTGLGLIEQAGGSGDELGLAQADGAVAQRGPGAGQAGVQVAGRAHQLIRAETGLPQRVCHLIRGELRVFGLGIPPGQLGDGGELTGGGVGLDPVPRAHNADQLGLGHAGEPVLFRGGVGSHGQLRAAGQHVEDHPGAERGRRAGRLAGEDPRRAGLARSAPPGGGRLDREQLIGGRVADLGQLLLGERGVVLVLFRLGRLVELAGPVQPAVPFRVTVQPGQVVWPRVRGNRWQGHEPRPFGRMIVLRT
jgi:hypothetical protein